METVIGAASVSFTDGNAAMFAYMVSSTFDSKAITRQEFVPPAPSVSKRAALD